MLKKANFYQIAKNASMPKFVAIIIALATLGFLADVAFAGKVSIKGTHDREEIRKTCANVGGSYSETGDSYSCIKECAQGDLCSVDCKDGKCTGNCPKCGSQEYKLPELGGKDAVENTLKNSVAEPSKR